MLSIITSDHLLNSSKTGKPNHRNPHNSKDYLVPPSTFQSFKSSKMRFSPSIITLLFAAVASVSALPQVAEVAEGSLFPRQGCPDGCEDDPSSGCGSGPSCYNFSTGECCDSPYYYCTPGLDSGVSHSVFGTLALSRAN
jgi:hypothetical protein